MSDVSRILTEIERGEPLAAERLLPLVYAELRKLASYRLSQQKPGQTLQATALVHEAWIRLVDREIPQQWDGRGHFFAAAAEAMRRILIEAARHRQSVRGGGDRKRMDLIDSDLSVEPPDDDLLALDEALAKFARIEPVTAEFVKLRIFAGMSVPEAAQHLGIAERTAKRNWAYARAWLRRELTDDADKGKK